MARPKTNPEKKLCKPIPVYLDKTTREKVMEFTDDQRMKYLSNTCRYIIESFFDKNLQKKEDINGCNG